MEPDRARQLLRGRAGTHRAVDREPRSASDPHGDGERTEPGDDGSEDLYQDEFDAGRAQDFKEQLAALELPRSGSPRGTYGLSVESGKPIPRTRALEVVPTAERTVEEERSGGLARAAR